ncbi:MAG: FAD binding domain-containing protein [Gemmatimonadaceae bacterium]
MTMYAAPFEYHRARSVEEAVALLGEHGGDAKLLAGGHSLIPLLKLRFAQPTHLIDVRTIPTLSGIREDAGAIVIGAATTHAQVERSAIIERTLPLLAEVAHRIGDPLVRNMGTVGGSLAHADPGADFPAAMLALEAEMRVTGPRGARTIAAGDFFVDLFMTALAPNDVLTEIRVPLPRAGTGGAYVKLRHPASGYALIGVAVLVTREDGRAIREARVALTGVGARAMRARGAEQALTGKDATAAIVAEAAERVTDDLELRADAQGSLEYKKQLAVVYVRRAITLAVERAAAPR